MIHSFIAALMILTASIVYAVQAIVITTDFTTGSLASVDSEGAVTDDLLLVHADARVRAFGDRVYILNRRGQDNIIVLNKADLATPLTQFSTGDGSNPHEIFVLSDQKAYVSVYKRDYLLVVDPSTGDSLNAIDLSPFSDADGLPEASQLAFFNGHLFVACQRLNRDAFFAPTDFSTVAVINTSTDELVDIDLSTPDLDGIRLSGTQPFGSDQHGANWVFAEVGSRSVSQMAGSK